MAGPWESYQEAAGPPGPWQDFIASPVQNIPTQRQAVDIGDSVIAGLQSSSMGLIQRGKLPEMHLPENAPWYHRAAAGFGGIVGDLPAMVAGAIAGAPIGTAVAGPGAGTVIGMGAGSFAAPMAIREALTAAYNANHASSWEGLKDIAFGALKGAVKGAVIGGATAGAGRVIAPLVAPTAGRAVLAGSLSATGARVAVDAATLGGELATLTTTAAALDGHLPIAQDFIDNAILLGGLKGAVGIAKGLRSTYAETGKMPAEVAADAQKDPSILADLQGKQSEPTTPRYTKDEARARLKELQPEIKMLSEKGGLTADEAARYKELTGEFHEVQYDAGLTAGKPEDIASTAERKSALSPETNVVIRQDVLRNRDIYLALSEAAAGVHFNADTPIDKIMLGQDSAVSPNELYDTFAKTRAALRKENGDTITLYRAVGQQKNKLTTNWATTEAFAKQFGQNVVKEEVPIERIIAANVNKKGTYHELIVGNPPETRLQPGLESAKPGYGQVPEAYRALALEERIKASIDADPRPEMMRKMLMNDGEPARLGEPPIKDPVKPEYITDQDTLKGVIRAVEQLYEPEIQSQTRGQVSNIETASAALRALSANGSIEHAIGTAENAKQLYARAHVLKSVLDEAYRNMAKLQGVPEAELTPMMKLAALASNEKVAMVYAEYRGARAEAGRALQIFNKIKRDNSLIGDAETLIKLAERKMPLQEIAKLATAYKDPVQFSSFLKGVGEATTTEKILEAWKAAILTGPQTHLANVAGNIMKWTVELPESTIAAAITAGKRALDGDPLTMAQLKARALAPLYGLQMGAVDALKVAGEVWRQKGEHVEKADIQRGAIEGKKGEIIRLPFKALQVEDVLFRTVAERAEAHIMAVDRAVEAGIDPRTLEGRAWIAARTADVRLGLEEEAANVAQKRVEQAGAEAVFAQQLGPRMLKVQQAMAGHWSQAIIPFFRTPANLLSWAVQHMPGPNFLSGRWMEDYKAGGERQNRAIARVVVGGALAMTAFSLAEQGILTGGGMFAKEEGNAKRAAGWQPYSILIGDKYYSYQRIEPVAKVIGLAADLVDMWQKLKDKGDQAKVAAMLVGMFGNVTISTTYLSGLSNLVQSAADPERYSENFLEQYASSLVPKLVGQTVTTADPYKREVSGVMDAVQSQLPFLRQKLMPKRDVWGQPVANDKWFDVMPVSVTQKDEDKVKQEAVRLHMAIADAPKFLLEKGPFKASERRIDLTAEQRDVYREVSGKFAMEYLGRIVNSPDWERIPDYAQAAIYRRVIELGHKQGAYKALAPMDAQRLKVREFVQGQILQQVEEAQQR